MRRRVETTKIIEVRTRSELRSAVAVEGKSSCFCSCTQSEIGPSNPQMGGGGGGGGGLRGAASIDRGTKSAVSSPDLVTFLPLW